MSKKITPKKKLRVIIVEDEALFAENLVSKIECASLGFEIVGMALQSEVALEMILKEKPDLVLSDIRMPRMDGLELISKVKETLPDIDFVLISGCLDFEYAQRGIRLGVKEYLNKPVMQDELNSILEKIMKQKHDESHGRKEAYIRKKTAYLTDDDAASEFINDTVYLLKICLLNRLEYGAQVMLEPGVKQFFLAFDVSQLLRKADVGTFITAGGGIINEEFLILDAPREMELDVAEVAQKIIDSFNVKYAPKSITVAYKPKKIRLSELGSEAAYITNELRRNIKAWHSSKIECGSTQGGVWKEAQLATQVRNFMPESLKSNPEEKIGKVVSNAFRHAYFNNNCQSYLQMYTLSAINALLPLYPKSEQKTLLHSREKLVCLVSLTLSLKEFVKVLSQKLYLIYNSKPVHLYKNENDIFLQVKEFVDENYYKEISVNDLAGKFFVSSKHLISLFKQRANITPLQYIIEKRIKEAKNLFIESMLSVKDVSGTVGYPNVNYFCRVFKEHEGVSPTEFKKRMESQHGQVL